MCYAWWLYCNMYVPWTHLTKTAATDTQIMAGALHSNALSRFCPMVCFTQCYSLFVGNCIKVLSLKWPGLQIDHLQTNGVNLHPCFLAINAARIQVASQDMIRQHGSLYSTYTVYPKKYAHGFVVLCFVVVMQSFIMTSHEVFIHIH